MNSKKIIVLLLCLIFALAMAFGVYAAVSYGSKEDPLITKSYLDSVLRPEIEAEMNKQVDEVIAGLESSGANPDFHVLTMAPGETLSCSMGCEILFRGGSAVSRGIFADTTAAADLPSGENPEVNHLYLAAEENVTLTAATEVTVLIKGSYKLS